MTPLRFAIVFCLAAIQFATVVRAEAPDDLDRYVGTYSFIFRNVTLEIERDGDRLIATPSNNLPSATLKPQSDPGRFSVVDASFDFHFLTESSGRVTGAELIRSNGQKYKLTRLIDRHAAAAPLRTLAVDAETSVNAHVYNGYERVKALDGRFKTETYTFGNGGFQRNVPVRDDSIDRMSFEELAHSLAPTLAREGYIAASDPAKTDLLLMVYWGATATDDHPAVIAEETYDPASHVFRSQINRINARVLGFNDALHEKAVLKAPGFQSSRAADLVDDLEESRYWIALVALDFPTARDEKKIKPLWSIRYNLPSRGTNFATALPQMTQVASHYFGRDSKGLVNRSTKENQGKVELGEQKVLGLETAD